MRILSIILFLIISTIFFESSAYCAEAAPYTEDAFGKIYSAMQKVQIPNNSSSKFDEHTAYQLLEYNRTVYATAGYSYDATLIKVANDMKNNRIPQGLSVAGLIVSVVHTMMSGCEYDKIDCLKLYPTDVAQAMKSIRTNSKFSL